MSRFGDVIPLASRRRGATAPERPLLVAPKERSGPLALLVMIVAIVGVGSIGLALQSAGPRAVAQVSSLHRSAIFDRAHEDLRETCRLPEAAQGPLRDHCVAEAAFVLLFPECDAACGLAARRVLPQARR
jgi:hypothetical protein